MALRDFETLNGIPGTAWKRRTFWGPLALPAVKCRPRPRDFSAPESQTAFRTQSRHCFARLFLHSWFPYEVLIKFNEETRNPGEKRESRQTTRDSSSPNPRTTHLGGFVRSRDSGSVLMLYRTTTFSPTRIERRRETTSTSRATNGGHDPTQTVGELLRFVKLKKAGANFVDCAIASIGDEIKFDRRTLNGLGALASHFPSCSASSAKTIMSARSDGRPV